MKRTARAWLVGRAAAVPPRLQTRMEEAVCGVTPARGMSVAEVLGEAALACLRDAVPHCDDRAAALDLLAADALITYACEAAAEDAAALEELCTSFAPQLLPGRLAVRFGTDSGAGA